MTSFNVDAGIQNDISFFEIEIDAIVYTLTENQVQTFLKKYAVRYSVLFDIEL